MLKNIKMFLCITIIFIVSSNTLADEYLGNSFQFKDEKNKSNIHIFESINNINHHKDKNYHLLRYYVGPQFVFYIPKKLKRKDRGKNYVYSLKVNFYNSDTYEQARKEINQRLKGYKIINTKSHISIMPHEIVTFKCPDHPYIKIQNLGTKNVTQYLIESRKINIYVSKDKPEYIKYFEEDLQDGSLNINARIYYKSKEAAIFKMKWNSKDIIKSRTFRNLDGKGANYFSAKEFRNMIFDISKDQEVFIMIDENINKIIINKAERIFDKMLTRQNDIIIRSSKQAEELNRAICKDLNLDPNDFKPIVVMWDIINTFKHITNYTEANKVIRKYFKRIKGKGSYKSRGIAKKIFGKIKASVSYDKIVNKYFSNNTEFKEFKNRFFSEKGKEPRITFRGLGIIERDTFKQNLFLTASSIAVSVKEKRSSFDNQAVFLHIDKIGIAKRKTKEIELFTLAMRKIRLFSKANIVTQINYLKKYLKHYTARDSQIRHRLNETVALLVFLPEGKSEFVVKESNKYLRNTQFTTYRQVVINRRNECQNNIEKQIEREKELYTNAMRKLSSFSQSDIDKQINLINKYLKHFTKRANIIRHRLKETRALIYIFPQGSKSSILKNAKRYLNNNSYRTYREEVAARRNSFK